MIEVKDLRGTPFMLNAELIEKVENNPDTQIVLTNGHRYYVKDTMAEVAEHVIRYRGACQAAGEAALQSAQKGA